LIVVQIVLHVGRIKCGDNGAMIFQVSSDLAYGAGTRKIVDKRNEQISQLTGLYWT